MAHLLTGILSLINLFQMQSTSIDALNTKAITELKTILMHRQKFIKVHAAEYLIWTGHPRSCIKRIFKGRKTAWHRT
jgi:hypothetical protein